MPAPLAALAARLGPIAAEIAIGMAARGKRPNVPMGAAVPSRLQGQLGRATQIGPQDIVAGGEGGAASASRAASLFGDLAKKLPPVVAALAALPPVAHALSNRFLEAQRSLTQYNATIAAAFHRLEVGRIQREIRRGGATAGSTRELADSTNRLETALLPISNLTTNLKNTFSDALNEAAIFLLNGIAPAFDALNGALFEREKPQPQNLQAFLDNRRHEWLDEQKQRRQAALGLDRPNGN